MAPHLKGENLSCFDLKPPKKSFTQLSAHNTFPSYHISAQPNQKPKSRIHIIGGTHLFIFLDGYAAPSLGRALNKLNALSRSAP